MTALMMDPMNHLYQLGGRVTSYLDGRNDSRFDELHECVNT
jgi:hypothetical protein